MESKIIKEIKTLIGDIELEKTKIQAQKIREVNVRDKMIKDFEKEVEKAKIITKERKKILRESPATYIG